MIKVCEERLNTCNTAKMKSDDNAMEVLRMCAGEINIYTARMCFHKQGRVIVNLLR